MMRKPQIIQTDGGGEFVNETVDNYLKENGIVHVVAATSNHQAIVERFNSTIVKPLFRYLTEVEESTGVENAGYNNWYDKLDDVVRAYNTRYHSGIKMKPNEVYHGLVKLEEPKDEEVIIDVDILSIGTTVRIPRMTTDFKVRATDSLWSPEAYIVSGSIKKSAYDPLKYKLMDSKLRTLEQTFYREELNVVNDATKLIGYSHGH